MIELSDNISKYIKDIFGNEFLMKYKEFIEGKYPVVIRKPISSSLQVSLDNRLRNQGIELEKIENIDNAYFVKKGENIIGKTIEHLLGKYYIQSLSSMIPPTILNPSKSDVVLDLCAAPGSKSTQIAEMMEYQGTLFSNEPSLSRVKALVHNLDKMNTLNMRIIKEKGELLSKRFPEYFNKILVDAPCSALGVMQKKQEVSNWWSSKSVDKISSLQLKLLISAIKMAKIGAEIVYSTCTLTIEENELIIDKVFQKYPVDILEFNLNLPHINGYDEVAGYKFDKKLQRTKRIIPWEIKSEGFFIAKLKKIGSVENSKISNNRNTKRNKVFVGADSKVIKEHLAFVSNHYGININKFREYKYIINDRDINFTNFDSADCNPDQFLRIGTKFGIVDKNGKLKLNSHAAQILGPYVTKNLIELNGINEIEAYFSGGQINSIYSSNGQKIIKYKGMFLGTGVVIDNKLKSQFPRSKRTGTITLS